MSQTVSVENVHGAPRAATLTTAAVVLNWNQAELTVAACDSLRGDLDRILVVDNGSEASDRAVLAAYVDSANVHVIWSATNLGYAAGNNLGLSHALACGVDAILVVNNDAFAEPGAVSTLLQRLVDQPDVGVAMPAVLSLDGSQVLHTGCDLNYRTGRTRWIDHGISPDRVDPWPRESGYVSGEAFLVRAETLRACGLFDERFGSYFEDVDLSIRIRAAGWRLEVVPAAVFRHAVGASGQTTNGIRLRTRNRVVLLHRSLQRPRAVALAVTVPAAVMSAGRLIAKGHSRTAVSGPFAGWIGAVGELFLHANSSTDRALHVFAVDSNGLTPYGACVGDAVAQTGVKLELHRRATLEGPGPHAVFGPSRGEAGNRWRRALRLLGGLLRVGVATRRARVVHLLWESPADAIVALIAKGVFRRPLVVTLHDPRRPGRAHAVARRVLFRLADRVVMHSEILRDAVVGQGLYEMSRILVLPLPNLANGTISVTREEAKSRLGLPVGRPAFLFFGAIRPYKGIETFVAAAENVLRDEPHVVAIVAGSCADAGLSDRIRALSKIHGGRVLALLDERPLPEELLATAVAAADLVVLPFNSASQSASVVYALSQSRAVVTTSVGENTTFAAAGAVEVIRPGDSDGLTEVCLRLLRDDTERQDLASRGDRFAREALDPRAIAAQLRALYAALA
jgi:GT2 family glycosyltransferase/glycosyltransferase involved in cell wall biosynthesis